MQHTFLFISFPFLHDYDVKMCTEAALQKASADKGKGFTVDYADLEKLLGIESYHNNRERSAAQNDLARQLFSGVSGPMLAESESLHRFARSYGYSISVSYGSISRFSVKFESALG